MRACASSTRSHGDYSPLRPPPPSCCQDATAWMGMFAGDMLTIAIELATHVSTAYEDVCTKARD